MSTSKLGKRNDFKHSLALGVEFIDYSSKLANFRKETDAKAGEIIVQSTSKVQSTVETLRAASSKETMNPTAPPSISISDHSEDASRKKKKQRRSMLGQRTNLYTMDNITNILNMSKILTYDGNETDHINKNETENLLEKPKSNSYLNIETPNDKNMMKPLHFSSPYSESNRVLHRNPQRNNEGSNTPPNPFGYEESVSKFFESDINEMGAWSVFKTKQTGIKSPSVCSSVENSLNKSTKSVVQVPVKDSVRKNFKTKLFHQDEYLTDLNKGNEERLQSTSIGASAIDMKDKMGKRWPDTSKSSISNSIIDNEITRGLDSDAGTSDCDSNKVEHDFTWNRQNDDCVNDDSFNIAESTIIAAEERSASKAPKLSIICEEDDKSNEICDKLSDLSDYSDTTISNSQEQRFNHKNGGYKNDFDQLNKLYQAVLMHSENLDKMFERLVNEKKIYNSSFKQLQKKMNEFHGKYYVYNPDKVAETLINSNGINSEHRKKKRVISTKVKHNSPVLMLTPDNALASPFINNSSKRKQSQVLKSYSELRKSFAYLKTPEQNRVRKGSTRSSLCYTPKSLSFCINKQLKSLDS